ncbi:MAG: DUF3488 and transglutaminase-like domain-containing protein [Bdellovibrionota bacterium]
MPLKRHLEITAFFLCAVSAAAYAGSEARAFPEALFFLLGVPLGFVLSERARRRVPVALWTALLVGLLAWEGLRAWRLPAEMVLRFFEFLRWLLVAKIFTRASARDRVQIVLLSFFVLLGATVYTYSILAAFFILAYLLAAPAALLLVSIDAKRAGAEESFPLPLRIYASSAFIGAMVSFAALAVFFSLPRLSQALIPLGAGAAEGDSQYPQDLDLGRRGLLAPSGRVLFRAQVHPPFEEPPLWRVAVLERFDGRRWSKGQTNLHPFFQFSRGAFTGGKESPRGAPEREIRFELRPLQLPALLVPSSWAFSSPGRFLVQGPFSDIFQSTDGRLLFNVLRTFQSGGLPLEYVLGRLPDRAKAREPPPALPEGLPPPLFVPRELDPRIRALALEIGAGSEDRRPAAVAHAVERYLSSNYAYALGSPPAADPLAAFLFERREGHCEYFASAAAVLLRTLGVPARVVTGFASGEFDPDSSEWVVRESDAHAWVEAFDPEEGWITVDPSPRDLAAEHARMGRLRLEIESWRQRGEMWWYQWVLRYSLADQVGLAARAFSGLSTGGSRARQFVPRNLDGSRWGTVLQWLVPGLIGAGLLGWMLLGLRRSSGSRELPGPRFSRILRPLYREAKRRGFPVTPSTTPAEAVRALSRGASPSSARELEAWAGKYNAARFGFAESTGMEKHLKIEWRRISRSLKDASRPAAD